MACGGHSQGKWKPVVSMRLLDARGEPRGESLRVETLGFTRDLVVAGDDATTLINWGIEVRSIDGDGQLLSTETPVPTESHCLSAARVGRGRLIAWCIDFENDDNGDPFLLDMDLDGTDSIIRPLDPQFADAHQVRLAFAGGQLFAAFGVDHDVFVAVFAEDGSLIAEPRRVGGADRRRTVTGRNSTASPRGSPTRRSSSFTPTRT